MDDRRRTPRYEPTTDEWVVLPWSVSVRVLDISLEGVLLQSREPLQIGARGRLRLSIGEAPLLADVEVRRVVPATGSEAGFRIGAAFVGMSPEHRQVIERYALEAGG
jgi:hypothetical protein